MFQNAKVLVTGATGMVGRQLLPLLLGKGALITAASLDKPSNIDSGVLQNVEFKRLDLRSLDNCLQITEGKEIVFHLAGVKGSPLLTKQQPASFFTNTMMFNLNVMEASRLKGVSRFLYTSSVGVYAPAEIFHEDDVWSSFPSENDKFAGYAKRMGELQAEALNIEYGWDAVHIVRPSNIYGPWDNFDPNTAMVIPSLIARVANGENPLQVWGDGTAIRDFIHSRDVARAMIHVMEKNVKGPTNVGSSLRTPIKEIVEILQSINPGLRINWQTDKPVGDDIRLMDIAKLKSSGFSPEISIAQGIAETFEWFCSNRSETNSRYNPFLEGGYSKLQQGF